MNVKGGKISDRRSLDRLMLSKTNRSQAHGFENFINCDPRNSKMKDLKSSE